ncbi:DUF1761 domain-containing protein [Primorskyibacter sp. 2E233]|uniref:DUF1761 domain-containing protein n=1 Tax=Primorskyibacter sp. 2E233 TaxID=3413431 RepID=UPI003BF08BF4
MELINVIVATVAAFAAGAAWYMVLSTPWLEAIGIPCDADGKPEGGQNPLLFGFGFILQLIVAGMMRHVFALSGIDSIGAGIIGGAGIGLFFITPWIALNNSYAMRPPKLTLIDGGYATVACAIMGFVLTLF